MIYKINISIGIVADTYDPSYSGGKDQEDHGLKPVQAKRQQEPMSTK
jgi:hypothetical protein